MQKASRLPAIFAFFFLALMLIFSFQYAWSTIFFHHILPYDQQRILEIIFLSLIAIITFIFSTTREKIINIFCGMRFTTQIALYGFLYLGLLSAIFSKIPMAGLLEWSLDVLLIFSAFCWATILVCFQNLKNNDTLACSRHPSPSGALPLRSRVCHCFLDFESSLLNKIGYQIIAGIIFLVIAVYIYPVYVSVLHNAHFHQLIILFPYFINIRFFSQFAILTLPLLPLTDIFLTQKKILLWLRPVLFLLSGFWYALNILNGSRGALYAFLISFLIALIIFRKALWPWIWRQCCFIALGIIGSIIFLHFYGFFDNSVSHLNTWNAMNAEPRMILYRYALHLAAMHPWLGVGPMHFAYAEPAALIQTHDLAAHPHNFLLLFLSEWGIPAFILLLFLTGKVLWNFLKAANHISAHENNLSKKIIYASFGMSLCAGLLAALVSGVMVTPLSQAFFAVIVGCCVALYFQENDSIHYQKNSLAKKNLYIAGIILVIGFCIFIVLYNMVLAAPHLLQSETLWLEKQGINTEFNPRFWLQGWLT